MKAKYPRSIKLKQTEEDRLSAFLEAHPSYTFPDVMGLAVSSLLDRIQAGERVVDSGRGLELVGEKTTAPPRPKQHPADGPANRVPKSA